MSGSHSRSIVFGATGVVGDAVVRLLSEKTSGISNEIIAGKTAFEHSPS